MPRFALVLVASVALAVPIATPLAADSLAVLLPALSFPAETVTSSTKDCAALTTQPTCKLAE